MFSLGLKASLTACPEHPLTQLLLIEWANVWEIGRGHESFSDPSGHYPLVLLIFN